MSDFLERTGNKLEKRPKDTHLSVLTNDELYPILDDAVDLFVSSLKGKYNATEFKVSHLCDTEKFVIYIEFLVDDKWDKVWFTIKLNNLHNMTVIEFKETMENYVGQATLYFERKLLHGKELDE